MTNSASFQRIDESDDGLFYQTPRLVQHIDDGFIQSLQQVFREVIPAQGDVLDLMSSWVSHLPNDLPLGRVTGLGMNAVELAANPQLKDYVVQSLNESPVLPYPSRSFDAVLITVSIQYVTRPLELMAEIARVLKPSGVVVISFSNRMFPTKAVEVWRSGSDEDHVQLVSSYLTQTALFTKLRAIRRIPERSGGWLDWLMSPQDPFFAVIAERDHRDPL